MIWQYINNECRSNHKNINTHFKNIVNNKVKAFEQFVIKNYNLKKTYEVKNPVLRKHFIINAIEEFN